MRNGGRDVVVRGVWGEQDAILVVKGDVITNSIRYLQRCEGYRPDVQHLDQSMMTYEWFTKKQARHFRNIEFPNIVYNPYKVRSRPLARSGVTLGR